MVSFSGRSCSTLNSYDETERKVVTEHPAISPPGVPSSVAGALDLAPATGLGASAPDLTWCNVVRRSMVSGLLSGSILLAACVSSSGATQAGPNDRAACRALDLVYATNGASPVTITQAETWSTLGLTSENSELHTSAQQLVTAAHDGDQSKVIAEFGIAAGICGTMGVGPGPGIAANTGT